VSNAKLDFDVDIRIYILMIYVPLLILCIVKDLKYLVPFSVIANVCIVIVFGITLYYMFKDGITITDDIDMIASYDKIPLFFATVIFAMEGIGVVSYAPASFIFYCSLVRPQIATGKKKWIPTRENVVRFSVVWQNPLYVYLAWDVTMLSSSSH